MGYDGLNRLTAAGETGIWSEGYGYDGFGNRWVSGVTGIGLSPLTPVAQSNYNASTNRLATTKFGYDNAGNETLIAPYTVSYDGEERQTGIASAENGSAGYGYDGEGRSGEHAGNDGPERGGKQSACVAGEGAAGRLDGHTRMNYWRASWGARELH